MSSDGGVVRRVAVALATVGGAGYSPIAPGTAGSFVTAVFLYLVPLSQTGVVVFFVASTVVGVWAAQHAERYFGVKDAGAIVIDEVAGMTLSVLTVPLTLGNLALGFFLFRVFDVVKPFPARGSQRLRGGVGVMIDDLIAGLYALIVLLVVRRVLGWP